MLLWILIALLTAAAILAVLVPLARAPAGDEPSSNAARVYRDQLAELDRDREEGRISPAEAEAARAEIARRLIALDSEAQSRSGALATPAVPTLRRATAIAALVGMPVLSMALYLGLGAPSLPGMPLAARLSTAIEPDNFALLIRQVEAHLADKPEDGRGWDVIAPIYLRLGRLTDSEQAYRNAIRLLGSTPERQAGVGEAILAAQGGIVTADARTAFEAAKALDSSAPVPRFYLALAAEQEGNTAAAVAEWNTLLAESPEGPFRAAIETALARVQVSPVAPAPGAGPSEEQIAAAQDMSAPDRSAMIESMVEGLATRLKDEPADVEGWLRLIRSYVVLGRADAASAAARSALDGVNASDRGRVEALIANLGVTPTGAASP